MKAIEKSRRFFYRGHLAAPFTKTFDSIKMA